MTTSVSTLAEDLQGILSSFGSMLEGVYHVDEDLAAEIAEKFADRLRGDVRTIYAEMTAEISVGLTKPPKKKKRTRRKTEDMLNDRPVDPGALDRIMGAEELPENENTLLPSFDGDLDASNLLNSERITDRASNRGGPPRVSPSSSNSWDTDNPTMRRIGGP
jgi:hypothetical protein